jgi:regulator of protease activity HflC (stomatin/prohibitin superfamily)
MYAYSHMDCVIERERRSTVITADGNRESAIIRSQGTRAKIVLAAEGEKTANIALAKGQAEARLLTARAEAASIEALRNALRECGARSRATDYLVALRYIQRLKDASETNKTNVSVFVCVCLFHLPSN